MGSLFSETEQIIDNPENEPPSSMQEEANTPTESSVNSNCNNFQCLISAALECQPISTILSYSGIQAPFFPGVIMSGQTKYEIKKSSGENNCTLIFSSPVTSFGISDEGMKEALSQGITADQITAQLQTMNSSSKLIAGMQSTCSSNKSTIVSYLTDAALYMEEGNLKLKTKTDLFSGQTTYTTSSGQKLVCISEDTRPKQIINTSTTITSMECMAQGGVTTTVTDDETACLENQFDLGVIEGMKVNGKSPQCCVDK